MFKRFLFAFLLLLGVAGFVLIPVVVGVDATLQAFSSLGGVCLLLYLVNFSLLLVVPGISWTILMRAEGLPVRYIDGIKGFFIAWPITMFIPSMYVGGEPIKAFFISKTYQVQARRVWATLIVGKFQEIAALMLIMILSLSYIIWRQELVVGRNEIILIATVGLLTSLFGAMLLFYTTNVKPLVKVINLLCRLGVSKRKLARARTKVEHMEQIIHESFTKRWRSFLISQSIVVVSAVSLFIRPWIFFAFVPNLDVPGGKVTEALCAIFITSNLINLFSITPGSLGTFEAGMLGTFALLGLKDHDATAFNILNRLADLALVAFGAWLLLHLGIMKVTRGKIKIDEGTRKIVLDNPFKSDETTEV